MLMCGKCKKKIVSTTSSLCVIRHKYDVIAYCHGESEKKSLSFEALKEAETPGKDIVFFAPAVEPKKPATVDSETFGREKRVRGAKGSES